MRTSNRFFYRFSHLKMLIFNFLVFFCLFSVCLTFSACQKEIEYFDYVSELRSNIFLAEQENYLLRIYAVNKETPYEADGIPKETSWRTEIFFSAPEGNQNCQLQFTANDHVYGGEMSFDNVKAEYYYSCTLDISELTEIPCRIQYGEMVLELQAISVRTKNTLAPKTALKNLQTTETELFSAMTDKYGFSGEIYLRLIYEDSPYYYIGIIDRNERIYAFLMNAETGKILAKRQS